MTCILGGNYFTPDICWHTTDFYGIMLRWDAHQLSQHKAEHIMLTARQLLGTNVTVERNASVNSGQVAIYGLSPITGRRTDAMKYAGGKVVFRARHFVSTCLSSELHSSHIRCITQAHLESC